MLSLTEKRSRSSIATLVFNFAHNNQVHDDDSTLARTRNWKAIAKAGSGGRVPFFIQLDGLEDGSGSVSVLVLSPWPTSPMSASDQVVSASPYVCLECWAQSSSSRGVEERMGRKREVAGQQGSAARQWLALKFALWIESKLEREQRYDDCETVDPWNRNKVVNHPCGYAGQLCMVRSDGRIFPFLYLTGTLTSTKDFWLILRQAASFRCFVCVLSSFRHPGGITQKHFV